MGSVSSSNDATGAPARAVRRRRLTATRRLVGVVLAAGAASLLYRRFASLSLAELFEAAGALPPGRWAAAVGLAALGYAALGAYDVLGLELLGRRVPWRRGVATGFVAFALGHNLGLALVWGAAVRYRAYAPWGLNGGDVARLTALTVVAFPWALLPVASALFVLAPAPLPGGAGTTLPLGVAGLAASGGLALWLRLRRPGGVAARLAGLLVAVVALDWIAASLALYVLLPEPLAPIGVATFLTLGLLAQIAAVLSHVPAGLGVLDAAAVSLLDPYWTDAALGVALAGFRLVYFVLPLLVALAIVGAVEIRARGRASAVRAERATGEIRAPGEDRLAAP